MIVEKARSQVDINSVLKHPEIYAAIAGDNAVPVDEWEPAPAVYVGGYVDDKPIAIMVFHPKNSVLWQLHIHVLPKYRKQYADDFLKGSLDWFWSRYNAKLIAEIPSLHQNVIKFAERHSFKLDGMTENGYLKNGKLWSLCYMSREKDK